MNPVTTLPLVTAGLFVFVPVVADPGGCGLIDHPCEHLGPVFPVL